MNKILSINSCLDKPTYIKYKINGEWKEVRYDKPVTIYLETIIKIKKSIDHYLYFLENEYWKARGTRWDGSEYNIYEWESPLISEHISSLPGEQTWMIEGQSWLSVWEQAIDSDEPVISCVYIMSHYGNPPSREEKQAFSDKVFNSKIPFKGVLFIVIDEGSTIGKPRLLLELQGIFNDLPKNCSFYIIEGWRERQRDNIVRYGEGTDSWERIYRVSYLFSFLQNYQRALEETVTTNTHNIKIYSPTTGLLAQIKNIIDFILPETPPFDNWIPDWLFDKRELDEYSSQPIEVEVSCECHPDCCKICSSKFPYFCCVKYTKPLN